MFLFFLGVEGGRVGNFEDVRFLPHIEFLPLLGCPLKDVRVLLHPNCSANVGPTPLFQLLEALFLAEEGGPKC